MPKQPKSHSEMRSLNCLICNLKGSSPRKITGKCLERVQKYFMATYDIENINYPSSVCGRCNNIITAIEKGTKTKEDLPQPLDLSLVKLPTPKKETRLGSSESRTFCDCYMCETGRQNPGQIGNSYGGSGQTGPHKMGRPLKQGPDPLPPRKMVKMCERCLRREDEPHPPNCGFTQRRRNLEEISKIDQRGSEILASKVIKSKVKASSTSDSTISLATAGPSRQLTLIKPYTRSVSKALFKDTAIPATHWSKVKTDNHLTTNQSLGVARSLRSLLGRGVIESNVKEKMQDLSHTLELYYSTVKPLLDSKKKKIRETLGPVEKVLVFNNDMLATNNYICSARDYSGGIENTFFRIGADSGRGSFKINGTIENLDEITKSDSKKWSYAVPSDRFKDSGVKRLIVYGKIQIISQSLFFYQAMAMKDCGKITTYLFPIELLPGIEITFYFLSDSIAHKWVVIFSQTFNYDSSLYIELCP